MAWHRAAMLIQCILQELFCVTTFVYVDDCFWVTPDFEGGEGANAAWQANVFQYVVEDLLGWRLDPAKTEIGNRITLL